MKVPFLDLSRQNRKIANHAEAIFKTAIEESRFIGGECVSKFEEDFAHFCNSKYAISVGNGTDALRLAIEALGAGVGDEVITSPFTFIATAEAITLNGAKVVFADIEEDTLNLDPEKIEDKITRNTKGIIPVHLFGNPANMDRFKLIGQNHNLWILEDACQAHGAQWNGKKVGSMGSCAAFSFYPTKNMGAFGDAGMITTSDENIANKIKKTKNHGSSVKYIHDFVGTNSRLDAIQAAILSEKLKYVEEWNNERRRISQIYIDQLADVNEIVLPSSKKEAKHIYHLFTIQTQRRDELKQWLEDNGIGSAIHYPIPIHMQKAYKHLGYKDDDFPVALKASKKVISIPLYPGLSELEQEYVIDRIKQFYKG